MRTSDADARLACRSDVEMAMVDDDADYCSNRNDKCEDTCHKKKLDGDHLNLPSLHDQRMPYS
jgi:hypothetical protein